MPLNPLYICDNSIQDYFVDKAGNPLSGGQIWSFQSDGITPKPLYQLTGQAPNYSYVTLSNPVTLSSSGTPQDSSGNNISLYYYPYDQSGNIQLYTIVVKDALGNPILTRQAMPNGVLPQTTPSTSTPTASYLVGWDFALNPSQFANTVGPIAISPSKSFYAWDQTIVFQSVDSGVIASRGPNGELTLTAAVAGVQVAIIQYLTGYLTDHEVSEMLNGPLSVAIQSKATTNQLNGITGTVSLWYGTGSIAGQLTIPTGSTVASGRTLVGTLDPNGHPVTANINQPAGGAWVEIPNVNGTGQFVVIPSSTTGFNYKDFSGWTLSGAPATQQAVYFAIVVGFGAMNLNDVISIATVSCVPGSIPTIPSPKAQEEVVTQCQAFYEKSYAIGFYPIYSTTTTNGQETYLSPSVVNPRVVNNSTPGVTIEGVTYTVSDASITLSSTILVALSTNSAGGSPVYILGYVPLAGGLQVTFTATLTQPWSFFYIVTGSSTRTSTVNQASTNAHIVLGPPVVVTISDASISASSNVTSAVASSSNPVTVISTTPIANNVVIVLSGNPGAAWTINYAVILSPLASGTIHYKTPKAFDSPNGMIFSPIIAYPNVGWNQPYSIAPDLSISGTTGYCINTVASWYGTSGYFSCNIPTNAAAGNIIALQWVVDSRIGVVL
jgi:hypothetical protein